MDAPDRLRARLDGGGLLLAPGAFDGMSARLVELAGFDAVYGSGGAVARSAGYPDIGLLTLSEVTDRMHRIVDSTDLPVIADADTGFGGLTNVKRTVQDFVRIGVAAFHLEDQTFPKRCGHLDDKSLIPADEMVLKVRLAKDVVGSTGPLVIARTDAIAVEGFPAAIERALAYSDAGADLLFIEAPESVEQIEEIAALVPGFKLINMFLGGKTPLLPSSRLTELGFHIAIIPSDLQRAAIHAMQQTLAAIARDGDSSAVADRMTSFSEREKIIRTEEFLKVDQLA